MTHFGKIIGKVQWIESKSFRHFYSKQNVQENLRHKNVDFQCKSLQKIFVIVLILYPNLTFLAFRAYLLEPPPQDYITKGKTIKNLNIKKWDKNYCTHSRMRIGSNNIIKQFKYWIPGICLGVEDISCFKFQSYYDLSGSLWKKFSFENIANSELLTILENSVTS